MLFPMRIRPFLSHKRTNAPVLRRLRAELQTRGAGAWKDTEDLRLGATTKKDIVEAINRNTGGFIWYGTRLALDSEVINTLEVPTALRRGGRDSAYAVTPVFIDLSPTRDRAIMDAAMGESVAGQLVERNGVIRQRAESVASLTSRIARRYVRDAVVSLPQNETVTAMITVFRPGDGSHDLTIDWRAIFDCDRRDFAGAGRPRATEVLNDLREALQERSLRPRVQVDLYLPLPLALFVGYEWRYTTGIRLEVVQQKGPQTLVVKAGASTAWTPIPPSLRAWRRRGPTVVAVGVGQPLDDAAIRYARTVGAGELLTYNVPGLVGREELLGLTSAVVSDLRRLNDRGVDKHLLLRGPQGMALLIGAAMNATGPTTVPFWNGSEYATELVVGAPSLSTA